MYFISWVKSKRFHCKVNSLDLFGTDRHIGEPHGFSIQISKKLRETFRQITSELCIAQTWELEKWLKEHAETKQSKSPV